MKVELTSQQLQYVMSVLIQQPYGQVASLIGSINTQVEAHNKAQESAKNMKELQSEQVRSLAKRVLEPAKEKGGE